MKAMNAHAPSTCHALRAAAAPQDRPRTRSKKRRLTIKVDWSAPLKTQAVFKWQTRVPIYSTSLSNRVHRYRYLEAQVSSPPPTLRFAVATVFFASLESHSAPSVSVSPPLLSPACSSHRQPPLPAARSAPLAPQDQYADSGEKERERERGKGYRRV